MKAKKLIAILQQHPEAEVTIAQYNGCDDVLRGVEDVMVFKKGDYVDEYNPKFCSKSRRAITSILKLTT